MARCWRGIELNENAGRDKKQANLILSKDTPTDENSKVALKSKDNVSGSQTFGNNERASFLAHSAHRGNPTVRAGLTGRLGGDRDRSHHGPCAGGRDLRGDGPVHGY